MATLQIDLPEAMNRMVLDKVQSGQYSTARDVIEAGLRALEYEDQERAKFVVLKAAIEEGLASGIAEDGVFDRIRAKYGLRKVEAE